MENENFITIQGFMRNELGLSGNDLLVFAIIYGFSQNGQGEFNGSLKYLAEWCGCSKQGVQKNLKNLLDKKLIEKHESEFHGMKLCSYTVQLSCRVCNSVVQGMQLSCTNNINIIKENNLLSNDNKLKEKNFSFEKHTNKENLDYLLENDERLSKLKADFKQALSDWCEYKDQRKPRSKHHYTEKGLTMVVNQAVNKAIVVGTTPVVNQINKAIASTWDGMNLDMIDKEKNNGRF